VMMEIQLIMMGEKEIVVQLKQDGCDLEAQQLHLIHEFNVPLVFTKIMLETLKIVFLFEGMALK